MESFKALLFCALKVPISWDIRAVQIHRAVTSVRLVRDTNNKSTARADPLTAL
jgi:hypothetical protein